MDIEFSDEPFRGPDDFASALSVHPIPSLALGEAVGEILEKVGEAADLVCLFVTNPHAGALEDIAAAVQTILDPKVMIGCAAQGVIVGSQEVNGQPALAIWAGNVGEVAPVRLEVVDLPGQGSGKALSGWPIGLDYVPAGSLLLADSGFPVPGLFAQLNNAGGFPRVVGAMTSSGTGPGMARLVLDGKVFTDGAVGVVMKGTERVFMQTAVCQGARGFGTPLLVTKSSGNTIEELDGQDAHKALVQAVRTSLSEQDARLAERGVLVGKAVDPNAPSHEGGFAVRSLLAADVWNGTITIGEAVKVGDVVQFHLPDAEFAAAQLAVTLDLVDDALTDEDELMAEVDPSIDEEPVEEPVGLLTFVDFNRATGFFDPETNDARLINDTYRFLPTAGIVAEATFGPIFGLNTVNGLATTTAFFNKV